MVLANCFCFTNEFKLVCNFTYPNKLFAFICIFIFNFNMDLKVKKYFNNSKKYFNKVGEYKLIISSIPSIFF